MPPASATRPIKPSRASTSRTRWPLPSPPIAGLQDMAPMVEKRWVTSAVFAPMRAAAAAASQPAWPPPMTMTSKICEGAVMGRTSILERSNPKAVSGRWGRMFHVKRGSWAGPALFHVKRFVNRLNEGILLSHTELAEDDVEDVFDIDPAKQPAEGIGR